MSKLLFAERSCLPESLISTYFWPMWQETGYWHSAMLPSRERTWWSGVRMAGWRALLRSFEKLRLREVQCYCPVDVAVCLLFLRKFGEDVNIQVLDFCFYGKETSSTCCRLPLRILYLLFCSRHAFWPIQATWRGDKLAIAVLALYVMNVTGYESSRICGQNHCDG